MGNTRVMLYKAVKHEVENYQADHGFNLVEMWAMVNSNHRNANFWRVMCIEDYAKDVLR